MRKILLIIVRAIATPIVNLFFPVTYLGKKRMRKNKQKILICNHLSMVEPAIVFVRHLKLTYFIGKSEFWKDDNKMMARILSFAGVTPVERGKPDIQAVRKIMTLIKEGKNIGVFPEGTRNKAGNFLLPFESGISMFAVKGQLKVAPLIIEKRPRIFKRNTLIAGDAIDLSEFYGERINSDLLEKTDKIIFEKMLNLKDLTDYYGTLEKEQKKIMKKLLNNPDISFDSIYRRFCHLFITHNGQPII